MKPCSVVMPYYKAGKLIRWQFENVWSKYPNEIKDALTFIVVDDGSPTDKVVDNITKEELDKAGIKLDLYVVTEDKIWNSEGASNLGIKQVNTDRFIRIDFDYHFPTKSMKQILNIDLQENEWYNFRVVDFKTRQEILSHVNTYYMMKKTFWKSGGYDEDFCGHYGWTDLLLERTFAKYATQFIRKDIDLVTCPFDSTHGLERDGERNKQLLHEKTGILCDQTDFTKNILRFQWKKVNL